MEALPAQYPDSLFKLIHNKPQYGILGHIRGGQRAAIRVGSHRFVCFGLAGIHPDYRYLHRFLSSKMEICSEKRYRPRKNASN
jgi:hypothetical protein